MRFLIITRPRQSPPPEMMAELFDRALAWVEANTKQGKMEHVWSFAGMPGGTGVLNVDSNEELDRVMLGYPMAPFSDIEIYGLCDMKGALSAAKEAVKSRA